MSLAAQMRGAALGLLEFLLPAVCPVCRESQPSEGGLCPGCLEGCGLEPAWSEARGPLSALGAATPYSGKAEEMIKGLKYAGRLTLARPLGHLLARAAEGAAGCDLVAPVPLHPRRLAERGFNQSLLLARELLAHSGLAARLAPTLLRRTRHTRPQVELSGPERAANVRGAFAVAPGARLQGLSVLLIDDVRTTGATLFECAAALRGAGTARVLALTVARAGA